MLKKGDVIPNADKVQFVVNYLAGYGVPHSIGDNVIVDGVPCAVIIFPNTKWKSRGVLIHEPTPESKPEEK